MADNQRLTRDEALLLARLANLDLPEDRLDQLTSTLSAYLDNLDLLWTVDAGDHEPPAITYESEARS